MSVIKKSNTPLSIFVVLSLFLWGCDQETAEVSQSQVAFSQDTLRISSDSLYVAKIDLVISPPAPVSSSITLRSTAVNDNFFQTNPPLRFAELMLPVAQNDPQASFSFEPLADNLGSENASVEFEIVAVGEGLITEPLEGRFLVVELLNNIQTNFTAPYQENFGVCIFDDFPPAGWEEKVIAQNNEFSARWGCITRPKIGIGINAFVPNSSDNSGSEAWILSPVIDLDTLTRPVLRFAVDRRFSPNDPNLEAYDLLISTDYDGDNFGSATWERFADGYAAMQADDPEADGFSESGDLDLSAYAGQSVAFAFVYRAGAPGTTDATILRIANFAIE